MPTDTPDHVRNINAGIARAYDDVPYDPPASPGLDAEHVFALAARYGLGRDHRAIDVLDLGCGTGAQVERAAGLTTGRVVGTDLSQSACTRATARIQSFGARCKVMCADVLDLTADNLGQFDLIYHVGVLYVTPPEVQRHLLDLIGRCLKPGGAAVISYYAGTMPLLMAGLHNILRGSADPAAPPQDRIRAARAQIQTIANVIARAGGDQRLMTGVLQQVYSANDTIFFHEMLNRSFAALSTAALEAALGVHGVHFLNWMQPAPFDAKAGPRERAAMADAYALGSGGYFYGVFGKTG